jgi:hypothetical protein
MCLRFHSVSFDLFDFTLIYIIRVRSTAYLNLALTIITSVSWYPTPTTLHFVFQISTT